jgi:hypothetical protein
MAMTMKVKATGSRAEVMHGTAKHTAGGLKKGDLMMRKGRIVSKKASAAGKKAIKRLRALGYIAKKGKFTLFKKMTKKAKKGSRKMRGGNFFEEISGSSGSM